MLLFLRLPKTALTPTGLDWHVQLEGRTFFIPYRKVHRTKEDGDDFLLGLNDLDVDALGLRNYVAGR